MSAPGHKLDILAALADTVKQKRDASPEQSYTARLLHQGIEKCAKKLGEEAIEAALAAMTAKKEHVRAEAADVFYHLLVLLEASGVALSEVMEELAERMQEGGLEEKASRKRP
jgi:phosphoribosyl-ATP pyrophosphohydrolase